MPQQKDIFGSSTNRQPLLCVTKRRLLILLMKLPETGMGYQIIEATVRVKKNKEIKDLFLVINCEYLLPFDDTQNYLSFSMLLKKQISIVNYNKRVAIDDIIEPKPTHPPDTIIYASPSQKNFWTFPRQCEVREKIVKEYEVYFRYSAFPKDHRITNSGDFIKNTYASTFSDINLITSGFAATSRYALPNPDPASYVYIIIPFRGTKMLKGTVSPAYYQAGGGVEIFFPNGAKNQIGKPYLIRED